MTCSGCGQSRIEASAKDAQGQYVTEPFYCWACAAVERSQHEKSKAAEKAEGKAPPDYGLKLTVKKR